MGVKEYAKKIRLVSERTKMDKFVISADWHLSSYSNDKKDEKTGFSRRLTDIFNTLVNMFQYCYDNNIKTVIMAGDMFHNKSIIHTLALNIATGLFNSFKNIDFLLIDGNHDLSGKGTSAVSSLMVFSKYPNVFWVGNVMKIDNLFFVPYSSDMKQHIIENTADILISHFGLNEAVLNSGISIRTDIKINDLKNKYKTVFLGHYHKPQEIIQPDISVYYTGSPIQLNWGEKNETKRFLVYDHGEISSIETVGYTKLVEFIMTHENKDEILKEVETIKDENVEIVIKSDMKDIKLEKENIRIVDISEEDISNRGLTTSMTKQDIFRKYLNIKEVPEELQDIYMEDIISVLSS